MFHQFHFMIFSNIQYFLYSLNYLQFASNYLQNCFSFYKLQKNTISALILFCNSMDNYQQKMNAFRNKYQLSLQQVSQKENVLNIESEKSKNLDYDIQIVETTSVTLIQEDNVEISTKLSKPMKQIQNCLQNFEMVSAQSIPIQRKSKQINFDQLMDENCKDSLLSIEKRLNSTTKFQQQTSEYISIKKEKLKQFLNTFKQLKQYLICQLQKMKSEVKQRVKNISEILKQQMQYIRGHFQRQLNSKISEIAELKNTIKSKNLLVSQSGNLIDYYQKQLEKKESQNQIKNKQIAKLKTQINKLTTKYLIKNPKIQIERTNQISFGKKNCQQTNIEMKQNQFTSNKQIINDFCGQYRIKMLSPSDSTKSILSQNSLRNKNEKIREIQRIKGKLNSLKLDIVTNGMLKNK